MASASSSMPPRGWGFVCLWWCWLLLGCESAPPGASRASPPGASDGIAGLDLDQPVRVTVERTSRERPLDAQKQTLLLRWGGGELILELLRTDALVSAGYTTFELDGRGKLKERKPAERPLFCHYRGRVSDRDATAPGMLVSLTTCDAGGAEVFVGLLRTSERLVELRPVAVGTGYELAAVVLPTFVDDVAELGRPELRAPALREQAIGPVGPSGELWVENVNVNDARRVTAVGSVSAAELSSLSIMNMLGGLYYGSTLQPPTRVGLIAQVSFTTDPYTATPVGTEVDTPDLLGKFSTWVKSATLPSHDHHQLMSGFNFQGTTVGLSYVGAICGDTPANVIQGGFSNAVTAAIAGHELGHLLGMNHDEALGCGSGFIMSQSVCVSCSKQPTDFSACSKSSLQSFLAGTVNCLANPITTTFNGPTCGNGILEMGEQCDCGAQSCTGGDACCNGAICKLVAGAQCSAKDACCDPNSCQPRPAGVVCRPAADACDTAESCNGSGRCPTDTYVSAGAVCSDGQSSSALCFQGHCLSREHQCHALEATYTNLGTLVACDSSTCGALTCRQQSTGTCYLFRGKFQDGTPCATGKQCSSDACVDSGALDPPRPAAPVTVPALGGTAALALSLLLGGLGLTLCRRSS